MQALADNAIAALVLVVMTNRCMRVFALMPMIMRMMTMVMMTAEVRSVMMTMAPEMTCPTPATRRRINMAGMRVAEMRFALAVEMPLFGVRGVGVSQIALQ